MQRYIVTAFCLLMPLGGCHSRTPRIDVPMFAEQPQVTSLAQLRQHIAIVGDYHQLLNAALERHDAGEYERAQDLADQADFLFPRSIGAAWFRDQLAAGQRIPDGHPIEFFNETDRTIAEIKLSYSPSASHARVRLAVRHLPPGEARSAHAYALPRNSTRLSVEYRFSDDDPRSWHYASARCFGSQYGYIPTITVRTGGSVSYFRDPAQ